MTNDIWHALRIDVDAVKPELSGSFEMINNDVDQDFSAGLNGTGKARITIFRYHFQSMIFLFCFVLNQLLPVNRVMMKSNECHMEYGLLILRNNSKWTKQSICYAPKESLWIIAFIFV